MHGSGLAAAPSRSYEQTAALFGSSEPPHGLKSTELIARKTDLETGAKADAEARAAARTRADLNMVKVVCWCVALWGRERAR